VFGQNGKVLPLMVAGKDRAEIEVETAQSSGCNCSPRRQNQGEILCVDGTWPGQANPPCCARHTGETRWRADRVPVHDGDVGAADSTASFLPLACGVCAGECVMDVPAVRDYAVAHSAVTMWPAWAETSGLCRNANDCNGRGGS